MGVVVGGLSAFLFSPKSGDEMRSDIANGVNDGVGQLRSATNDLRRRGQKLVNMAKEEAADALEATSGVFNHTKRG